MSRFLSRKPQIILFKLYENALVLRFVVIVVVLKLILKIAEIAM